MRTPHVALILLALATTSPDSAALPDGSYDGGRPPMPPGPAGAPRVVIPPRVEEAALPAFDAEPFPEEKSKAPRPSEWKEAPRVRLSRVAERITECTAFRVREWIEIHCDRKTAGLRLIAGSTDGIELWVPEPLPLKSGEIDLATAGRFGEIVFPVRRGDRRVFEAVDFDFEQYEGWGTRAGVLVEERWAAGAKSPEIALLSP